MKEVDSMIITLKNHPCAQCCVTVDERGVRVFSYDTLVIKIDRAGWLDCTGLYSKTTRRQISWFLREYAPMVSYQMVKQCVKDRMVINIDTGEVLPIYCPWDY